MSAGIPRSEGEPAPLRSVFSDDPEMADLVSYFVSELDERVHTLIQAMDQRNLGTIRSIAHDLKGAAGGYGFSPIGHAAARLEEQALCDEADANLVREALEDLIVLCRRARATA